MRYLQLLACLTLLLLAAGCSTPSPDSLRSPDTAMTPQTTTVPDELTPPLQPDSGSGHRSVLTRDTPAPGSLHITVHTATVHTLRKRSGGTFSVIVLNVSVKNEGLDEVFFFDNRSLVWFQSDSEHIFPEYPQLDYHQVNITDPLLLRTVAPGEEVRGEVYFYLNEPARSLVLYVTYPNWTIVGGTYIPDISDLTQSIQYREYPKNLELVVPSAVQKATIPGFQVSPGHTIAIINVSITNNNPTDVTIRSEHVLLLTEKPVTLEHGRERSEYLRFPFVIHPGETKSGSVLFGVYSGTRTNKLALTDSNFVIQSLIDLNDIYRYEF